MHGQGYLHFDIVEQLRTDHGPYPLFAFSSLSTYVLIPTNRISHIRYNIFNHFPNIYHSIYTSLFFAWWSKYCTLGFASNLLLFLSIFILPRRNNLREAIFFRRTAFNGHLRTERYSCFGRTQYMHIQYFFKSKNLCSCFLVLKEGS